MTDPPVAPEDAPLALPEGYVGVFPVEARMPHIWHQANGREGRARWLTLCRSWSVDQRDTHPLRARDVEEFLCRTCARKAGLL